MIKELFKTLLIFLVAFIACCLAAMFIKFDFNLSILRPNDRILILFFSFLITLSFKIAQGLNNNI